MTLCEPPTIFPSGGSFSKRTTSCDKVNIGRGTQRTWHGQAVVIAVRCSLELRLTVRSWSTTVELNSLSTQRSHWHQRFCVLVGISRCVWGSFSRANITPVVTGSSSDSGDSRLGVTWLPALGSVSTGMPFALRRCPSYAAYRPVAV
jgi:hypothetical protein